MTQQNTQRERFRRAYAQACATLSARYAREGAGAHELDALLKKHTSDAIDALQTQNDDGSLNSFELLSAARAIDLLRESICEMETFA